MNASPVLTKGKLLKYGPMIRCALEETNEIHDVEENLVDVLNGFDGKSELNENLNEQFMIRPTRVDLLVEKKLLSVKKRGWQVQYAKQKLLENRIRMEIGQERPEDHLRRFTRAFKKTISGEPLSPEPNVSSAMEDSPGIPSRKKKRKIIADKKLAEVRVPIIDWQNYEC